MYFPWYPPNEDGEDPHSHEVQIYCPSEDRWHWMPATAKHCRECEAPLLPTPQCPHCGCDLIPDRGVYCKQCGTQLPPQLAAPQEIAFGIFIKAYGKLTETQTQTIFQDFWENLEKISLRLRHGRDLWQTMKSRYKPRNELLYGLDRREMEVFYMNIRDPRTASTLTQLNELQEAFDDAAKETGITVGVIITDEKKFALVRAIMSVEKPAPEPETSTQPPPPQPTSPRTIQENIRDAAKTTEQIAQQIIDAHRKLADRLDKFIGRPTGLVYVTCPNCGTGRWMPPQERFCDKCRTRLR